MLDVSIINMCIEGIRNYEYQNRIYEGMPLLSKEDTRLVVQGNIDCMRYIWACILHSSFL